MEGLRSRSDSKVLRNSQAHWIVSELLSRPDALASRGASSRTWVLAPETGTEEENGMDLYHIYHYTTSSSLFWQKTDLLLLARGSRLNDAHTPKVSEPVNVPYRVKPLHMWLI